MKFEDWKELVKSKPLDVQLMWLMDSYDRYRDRHAEMWDDLTNCSVLTKNEGFKEACAWAKEECDAQKERYEWLLNYIYETYKDSSILMVQKGEGNTQIGHVGTMYYV